LELCVAGATSVWAMGGFVNHAILYDDEEVLGGVGDELDIGDGVAADEDVHRGGEGVTFAVEEADVGEEGGRGWGCLG
jgi:hypothetical protein